MKKSELIESPDEGKHQFTEEEISACINEGECCRCGVCCIGTEHEPTKGPVMEICEHLKETVDGLFICEIFTEELPCNRWKGNKDQGGMIAGLTDFMRMTWAYTGRLGSSYAKPEDIAVAEKLMRRGAFRPELSGPDMLTNVLTKKGLKEKKIIGVLSMCIFKLDSLPHNFLRKIGTKEWFESLTESETIEWLKKIGFNLEAPSEKETEFLQTYVPKYIPETVGESVVK